MGASRVMKSLKRGEGMFAISPDLTTRDTMKIRVSTTITGGVTPDVTGAETFSTIVSLNESTIRPGLLFAGTDDGKVWISRNDGGSWEDLTGRFPGVPAGTYVSRIEPSRADSTRFYVTFDNHRNGDYTPYVYATNDFGRSFRSIASNLPTGGPDFVHVVREDPVNQNLLYLGTDVGAYVSVNRGASWQRFMTGLPIVPVHDLQIHPRDREMIAGTHGRSIWVVDVSPLQQATDAALTATAHLFTPRTGYQINQTPDGIMGGGGGGGQMQFQSNSPNAGAEITYRVAAGAPVGAARIVIQDAAGDTVQTLSGPGGAGLQRVYWNYQGRRAPRGALSPAGVRDSAAFAKRLDRLVDSLVTAGGNKSGLDSARAQLLSGQMFGFGGGGGGAAGLQIPGLPTFRPRPGEGGAGGPGGPGGGGGGGGFGGTPLGQLAEALGGFQAIQGAIPFTPQPIPSAAAGDYLVTVTVAGQTMRKKLRVERVKPTGGLATGETGF
jgi:hypothetical protein